MSGANEAAAPRPRSRRQVPGSEAAHAFVIALVLGVAIGLIQGKKPFFFDSGRYWALSETFTGGGHFSLFDFHSHLRGYALPMIYHLVRASGGLLTDNGWIQVVVLNATLFAAIGALLAPRLAAITWPGQHWGLGRRLLLCGLLLAFWRGYISYPLSDLPALAAGLLAIVAVSSPSSPVWMGVAGASAALAVEFRPSYLVVLPALLAAALWSWHKAAGAEWRRRAGCLAVFAVAAAAIMLPQSLVRHHLDGSYSPIPGGDRLAALQYTTGLEYQRYDTFVGKTKRRRRQPSLAYIDPSTDSIVAELGIGGVQSTTQYAEIVARHPLIMAGVFLRHIVNGLDQRYSTPYIERIHPPGQWLWRFAGFLVVFLALTRLAWGRSRRRLGPAQWRYSGVLLLASITSVASAVEQRFLLPVFVLCMTVLLAPGWVVPVRGGEGVRRYREIAVIVTAGAALLAVALWIVTGASDNLQAGLAE